MSRPKLPLSEQKLAFARQKAQAKYRGEGWQFDFDSWWQMWQPFWSQRGMRREDLCMIREDAQQPWRPDNCVIVTREEYLCYGSRYYYQNRLSSRPYARKIPS